MMGQEFSGDSCGDFRCALGFGSRYTNVHFDDSKWNAANLSSSTFTGCTWHRCDLTQVNFNASLFSDCTFRDCTLDLATFEASKLDGCAFVGGRAEYANFHRATLNDVRFDIQLHGADLRWAAAEDVDMGESNLWGASINVSCAQFRRSAFSKQQLRLFLALLTSSKDSESATLRVALRDIIGEDVFRTMDRLTLREGE